MCVLGSAGFFILCVPGFTEIAKPSCKATRGQESTLNWTKLFIGSRKHHLRPQHLPCYKPFHLNVDENKGIAKGVLIQTLGPWKGPVAYLSKKLDLVVCVCVWGGAQLVYIL